jgi:hypothetical protein
MLRCLKGENKKQTVLGAGKVSSSAVALPTLSVQLYCRWENEWRRKLPLLRAQLGGREENRYFSLQCVPACGVLLETRFLFLVDPTQCVPLFFMMQEATLLETTYVDTLHVQRIIFNNF